MHNTYRRSGLPDKPFRGWSAFVMGLRARIDAGRAKDAVQNIELKCRKEAKARCQ